MKHCVFIQTNHKQITGAIVAKHALRRYSSNNDKFDVQIIDSRDYPFFAAHEGQEYLRDGVKRVWLNDDLQSFTPTRFMPPKLMGYEGRAVVIDPDIFAAADVWELLSRDMQGKAILCRPKSGSKGKRGCLATSVMLLDNARLTHWKVEQQFNEMFEFKRDYKNWISLADEPRENVGFLEADPAGGIYEVAEPMGVVAAVIPSMWEGWSMMGTLISGSSARSFKVDSPEE